jgi:hypothetical protein
MKAFEQEGRAYTWLIPTLQRTRSEKNLKPLAFPKCFYLSVEDSIILLENLKMQNYEVVEKKPERKYLIPIFSNMYKQFTKTF